MSIPVCAVVGVGEGNGAALARSFAQTGMAVALLARRTDFTGQLAGSLPDARAYACDASDPAMVAEAFARIREELGDPTTLIYNAGPGVWGDVESIGLDTFEAVWRANAYEALAASQQVIPAMKQAGAGTIIFIGATASLCGGPQTAPPRRPSAASRNPWPAASGRRASKSPSSSSMPWWTFPQHARQAGQLLPEARRHGCHRRVACPAATLGLDVRGGGQALRRELVRLIRGSVSEIPGHDRHSWGIR
jgi:NAD(P)-dependent dehydrogenase (short-subunit alcohol dehydrogenase family)